MLFLDIDLCGGGIPKIVHKFGTDICICIGLKIRIRKLSQGALDQNYELPNIAELMASVCI